MENLKDHVLIIASETSPEASSYGGAGYCVQTPYKGTTQADRILRAAHIRMNLPLLERWYNEKFFDRKWELVIVIEGALTTPHYLRWLCKRLPDSKIMLMYSNPISKMKNPWLRPLNKGMNPQYISDTRIIIWTFDPGDAERYGLYFYHTIGHPGPKKPCENYQYDAVFVGQDKGRKKKLLKLESEMRKLGLNPYFHIVAGKPVFWDRHHVYKERLPYSKVVELMENSRCVVDFLQKGQTGVSMRTSASISNQTKVITNTEYVKKCKYYDPRNIFIVGVDDWNELREFIDSPFAPVDPALIDSLAFEKQLETVFQP